MGLIIFYFAVALVGYFVGSRLKKAEKTWSWTGKAQFVAIIVLVYMMGSRIGAEESVIASLGELGLISFILTVFILAGSVACVFFTRKLFKINKEGVKEDD